ncbi:ECM29 [Mytilus edulis]|uniref:ECM29 n=1 Tax=Mytilus edulis TaxID=6550 RepID=A0A8S3T1S8_MYTED|nr:ECM29 [Mytilus edulis]
MVKLIGEATDEAKLRNLAYVAVGKIVRRAPQLVKKDVALVQKFFDAMSKEDPETRLGVQESLSLMADAFKDIDPSCQSLMEALIMQNIEQDQPQSRLMSVQYARTVFPSDHIPSRYILLLACGDTKEDVRVEAMKALHIAQTKEKEIEKNSTKLPPPKLPKFTDMMKYISEKGSLRVKTQNKYVIGNNTLPFIPQATYEQVNDIVPSHMSLLVDNIIPTHVSLFVIDIIPTHVSLFVDDIIPTYVPLLVDDIIPIHRSLFLDDIIPTHVPLLVDDIIPTHMSLLVDDIIPTHVSLFVFDIIPTHVSLLVDDIIPTHVSLLVDDIIPTHVSLLVDDIILTHVSLLVDDIIPTHVPITGLGPDS